MQGVARSLVPERVIERLGVVLAARPELEGPILVLLEAMVPREAGRASVFGVAAVEREADAASAPDADSASAPATDADADSATDPDPVPAPASASAPDAAADPAPAADADPAPASALAAPRLRRLSFRTLQERFELKRDACHAITKLADLHHISARADELGIELWMLQRTTNKNALDALATAFDHAARISRILKRLRNTPDQAAAFELASRITHHLMRTTHHARTATRGKHYWFDPDQRTLHKRIHNYATEQQHYLPYLAARPRAHEPLNPHTIPDDLTNLETLLNHQDTINATHKSAAYHAKRLTQGTHDPEHQQIRLEHFTRTLNDLGVPLNDRQLQRTLRPLARLDLNWSDAPTITAALHLSTPKREHTPHAHTPITSTARFDATTHSRDVHHAKALLRGGRIVLVGGLINETARQRLAHALECDVEWIEGYQQQGDVNTIDTTIKRPGVILVITLIAYTSHTYYDAAAASAKTAGVPLVRNRAGYSVNAIAHAILTQAADALSSNLRAA